MSDEAMWKDRGTGTLARVRDAPRTVLARAPARIDFSGGYTDVAPFTEEWVGYSVNAAVTLGTSVFATRRIDRRVVIRSEDFGLTVRANSPNELRCDGHLDLVKAAVRRLARDTGINMTIKSTAPAGAGLGTSASVGVAVVGALSALAGEERRCEDVAELAAALERESGTAGGRQDQYASALGGFNFLEYMGREARFEALLLTAEQQSILHEHLVLAHRGRPRHSGRLISEVMSAYSRREEPTRSALLRLDELALAIRAALDSFDLHTLGGLIDQVRQQQEALDSRLIGAEARQLLWKAADAGARSGKIAGGAGPGACVLLFCDPGRRTRVIDAATNEGWRTLNFDFQPRGLTVHYSDFP